MRRTKIISWVISACVPYTTVMGDKVSPQYNVIKILLKIKRLLPARCEFILSLTAVTAKRERERFYNAFVPQFKRL